jgi:hypothetical protein
MLFEPMIIWLVVVGIGMMLSGIFLLREAKRMKERREAERKDETSEQ